MYFSGSFLAWSAKNLRTRLVKTSRSFLFKRKKKEKKIVKYPKPIGMGVGQRQAWQESGKSSNVSPKFFCLKHIVRKFSTINTQAKIIHPISYPFIGLSLWKYIHKHNSSKHQLDCWGNKWFQVPVASTYRHSVPFTWAQCNKFTCQHMFWYGGNVGCLNKKFSDHNGKLNPSV